MSAFEILITVCEFITLSIVAIHVGILPPKKGDRNDD
jgi:hypothetical protein